MGQAEPGLQMIDRLTGSTAEQRRPVLIVDDEPQVLDALADTLEDDFEVLTAASATEGEAVVRRRPDLSVVMSDQRMPGMAGHEFLAKVRALSYATRMLITGYADLDAVVKAVNEGQIFGYVPKPWRREELRLAVRRAAEHHALARDMREERDLLRNLLDNVPDAICFIDRAHRFLRLNAPQAGLLGVARPEDALGRRAADLLPPAEAAAIAAAEREILEQGRVVADQLIARQNGDTRWYSVTKAPIRGERGEITGLVSISRDVTARHRAEEALRENEQRLRSIAENLPGVIFRFVQRPDGGRYLEYISQGCERLYGFTAAEALADVRLVFEAVHPSDRERFNLELERALKEGTPWNGEFRIVSKDGSEHWIASHATPHRSPDGGLAWDGLKLDISERKRAETRLQYLAQYDAPTGLPNRTLLLDRVRQAALQAQRDKELVGVIQLRLDQRRMVSETLGSDVAEALVRLIAERLRGVLDEVHTLARLGFADLGVIASGCQHLGEIDAVVQRLRLAFETPAIVADHTIHLTATIGVAVFPDDAASAETLLRYADIATHRARLRGEGSVQFYTADMNDQALRRLSVDQCLRQALAKEEFTLFYQPQVDARSGQIIGSEALIRLPRADGTFLPPSHFIPIAEESGLIVPLGRWILERVCAQLQAWEADGVPRLPVAVNVSARQFAQRDLVALVRQLLTDTCVPPALLKIEVTESTLMNDFDDALAVLDELRGLGVGLVIDDFGTGYSSLNYLRRLPVKTVKIDQSFVRQMTERIQDAAIVETVIRLAHSLGMSVVAEGVENPEQLTYLRAYACDAIQGFLFHHPVPGQTYASRLREAGGGGAAPDASFGSERSQS